MPFINMAGLLQPNLVISRAGGTLTELAVTGTPSILIPLPTAASTNPTMRQYLGQWVQQWCFNNQN